MGVFTFIAYVTTIGCITGVAIAFINRNKEPRD